MISCGSKSVGRSSPSLSVSLPQLRSLHLTTHTTCARVRTHPCVSFQSASLSQHAIRARLYKSSQSSSLLAPAVPRPECLPAEVGAWHKRARALRKRGDATARQGMQRVIGHKTEQTMRCGGKQKQSKSERESDSERTREIERKTMRSLHIRDHQTHSC